VNQKTSTEEHGLVPTGFQKISVDALH